MAFDLATAIITIAGDRRPIESDIAATQKAILRDLGAVQKDVQRILSGTQKDARSFAQRAGTVFRDVFVETVGTAAGIAVARSFDAAARTLQVTAQNAFRAVESFEFLEFGIQSLVAREIKLRDGTISLAEAFDAASPRAQELLRWIEQLAVASPFDIEGVAATFRQAQAYGFATEEAQRLTQAIIDFTAGTGQSTDVSRRIALALGQIRSRGALASQELNQLTEAGINVRERLGDALGITGAQLTEWTEDRIIPAGVAVEAIVKTLEEDFGGAARRAMDTLRGLVNSLRDLRDIGLRDLFGPALRAAQQRLSALVGVLNTPQTRARLQAIGDFIGRGVEIGLKHLSRLLRGMTQMVKGWVSELANMERSTARSLGRTAGFFTALLRSITQIGLDIMRVFAAAIGAGVRFVGRALAGIGDALKYWLEPRSPPRIAPDLDVWGREAAETWLEGWSDADFGAFQRLGEDVESMLATLVDAGQFDGGDLVQTIQSIRNGVVGALKEISATGSVGAGAFRILTDATEKAGGALARVTELYVKWEQATSNVRDAQARLRDVVDGFDSRIAALREGLIGDADDLIPEDAASRIREIDEALEDVALSEEERAALREERDQIELGQRIRELERERAAAVAVEQAKVREAEATARAIREQLDIAHAQLAQERKLLELLGQQRDLMEEIAGEERDPLEDRLRGLQLQADELEAMIRLAQIQRELEDDQLTAAQRRRLELERQTIETERQIRAAEAAELGISLDDISQIALDPRDLGKITDELELQLEKIDLQQRFLASLIDSAKNRLTIESSTATAAEKTAAALALQREEIERAQIAARAAELGVDLSALLGVPISFKDLGLTGETASAVADTDSALQTLIDTLKSAEEELGDDPLGLGGLRVTLEEFRKGFEQGETTVFKNFARDVKDAFGPLTTLFETLFGQRITVTDFAGGELERTVKIVPGLLDQLVESFSREGVQNLISGFADAVREADWTEFAVAVAESLGRAIHGHDRYEVTPTGDEIFIDEPGLLGTLTAKFDGAIERLRSALGQQPPVDLGPEFGERLRIGQVVDEPTLGEQLQQAIGEPLERALNALDGRSLLPRDQQIQVDLTDLWSGGITFPPEEQLDAQVGAFVADLDIGKKIEQAILDTEIAAGADIGRAISNVIAEGLGNAAETTFRRVGQWVTGIINGIFEGFTTEEGQSDASNTLRVLEHLEAIISGAIIELAAAPFRIIGEVAAGVIDGLIEGFSGEEYKLREWWRGLVDRIVEWIKEKAGIASPATLFVPLGIDMVRGVGAGFVAATGELLSKVAGMLLALVAPPILADFNRVGATWAAQVAGALIDGISGLRDNLFDGIESIRERMPSVDLGDSVVGGALGGLRARIRGALVPEIEAGVNESAQRGDDLASDLWARLWEQIGAQGALSAAREGAQGKIAGTLDKEVRGALDTVTRNAPTDAQPLGRALVDGLVAGTLMKVGALRQRVDQQVEQVVHWFTANLRIVGGAAAALFPIGESIPEGLAFGMLTRFTRVKSAAHDLADLLTQPDMLATFYGVGEAWVKSLWSGIDQWWARMLVDLQQRVGALQRALEETMVSGVPRGSPPPAPPRAQNVAAAVAEPVEIDISQVAGVVAAALNQEPVTVINNFHDTRVERESDIRQLAVEIERTISRRRGR